jgi:hypothetical protein
MANPISVKGKYSLFSKPQMPKGVLVFLLITVSNSNPWLA